METLARDRRDRVFLELGRTLAAAGVTPRGVLHVGANVGQELEAYLAAGFRSAVLVEPMAAAAAAARREADRLGWDAVTVIEAAVGTRPGSVTLHVADDPRGEMSSTLQPQFRRSRVRFQPLKVEQVRLDTIDVDGVNVLVLDVQGSEADVLRSGPLDGFDAVVVEVRRTPAYVGQAAPAEVATILADNRFTQVLEVEHRTIADQVWVRT